MNKLSEYTPFTTISTPNLNAREASQKQFNSDRDKGFSRSMESLSNQNNNIMNMQYPAPMGWMHIPSSVQSIQKDKIPEGFGFTSQIELTVNAIYQLKQNIMQLSQRVDLLQSKLLKDEDKTDTQPIQKKKNRRKAQDINKMFCCSTCSKSYGSQVSLNLHYRLKHPNLKQVRVDNQQQLTQSNILNQSITPTRISEAQQKINTKLVESQTI